MQEGVSGGGGAGAGAGVGGGYAAGSCHISKCDLMIWQIEDKTGGLRTQCAMMLGTSPVRCGNPG